MMVKAKGLTWAFLPSTTGSIMESGVNQTESALS